MIYLVPLHRVCKSIEKMQSLSNLAISLRCCARAHFMSLQTKSTAQMAHYTSPNQVCMLLLICCHLHARNFGVTHGQQMRMIESSMEVYHTALFGTHEFDGTYAVISHEVDATTAFPLESGDFSCSGWGLHRQEYMLILMRCTLFMCCPDVNNFFEFGYNYVVGVSFYALRRHRTLIALSAQLDE